MAALVVKYHANKVTFDEMEKQRQSLERAAQTKEFDRYRMETDKTRKVLDGLK